MGVDDAHGLAASPASQPRTRQGTSPSIANWAITWSQGVLAWELRSATSLARLLVFQGRVEGARTTLETVYAQFTQGFGIANLLATSGLLAELSADPRA